VVAAFRARLHPDLADDAVEDVIDQLLVAAAANVATALYDRYQYYANGIL
jgi:hypothetical protein